MSITIDHSATKNHDDDSMSSLGDSCSWDMPFDNNNSDSVRVLLSDAQRLSLNRSVCTEHAPKGPSRQHSILHSNNCNNCSNDNNNNNNKKTDVIAVERLQKLSMSAPNLKFGESADSGTDGSCVPAITAAAAATNNGSITTVARRNLDSDRSAASPKSDYCVQLQQNRHKLATTTVQLRRHVSDDGHALLLRGAVAQSPLATRPLTRKKSTRKLIKVRASDIPNAGDASDGTNNNNNEVSLEDLQKALLRGSNSSNYSNNNNRGRTILRSSSKKPLERRSLSRNNPDHEVLVQTAAADSDDSREPIRLDASEPLTDTPSTLLPRSAPAITTMASCLRSPSIVPASPRNAIKVIASKQPSPNAPYWGPPSCVTTAAATPARMEDVDAKTALTRRKSVSLLRERFERGSDPLSMDK
jgi:hypothetical protein